MHSESRVEKVCGLIQGTLTPRNLVAVYFIINSIGLVIFTMLVATVLARFAQPSIYVYADLYAWAKPPVTSLSKLATLLQYVLPVVALFIYYVIFLHVTKYFTKAISSIDNDRLLKISFYFLSAIVINIALFFISKEQKLILGALSILWLFLFLWIPFTVFRSRPLSISIPNLFWVGVLCVILIQYAAVFIPLITKPLMVENNYLNIAEKTILNSGKVVDNIGYINEHKLAGLKIYDPSNGKNIDDRDILSGLTIPLEYKKGFDALLNAQKALEGRQYSIEEKDFISRNGNELLNQTKAGWFFYHHNYNYGPMNALSLGAAANNQTMVYGWLNTVTQSKVLESLGMLNYQGYFKLYFSEYLAYFGIFLLGVWAIFKRLRTVVFAAVLVISALFFLGFELIKLAPGFNPVRHIFDMPAFYLLYRYLVRDRKIYLILACIISLFAIFWSKDFGLFLTLSIGGAILFNVVRERPFQLVPLFVGGITVIAGMLLYFYPMPGANPTAIYMFLGVGAPIATSGKIFGLLVIISLLLAITIHIKQNKVYTVIAVGMALYFVLSLTYYIWYPVSHHILGVAPVFILWLVVLFHGWTSQSLHGERIQSNILVLLLIFIYLPASVSFYRGQYTYNQIFKNHQLYQWKFDKAKFVSTMDPTLFEEAGVLIQRYSPDSNGIFIISKYDHILPILASKYSAMPYNELPTNLVSPKEVEIASEAILKNKPAYLFIDSDIGRNLAGEIPIENDLITVKLGLYGEATARVLVLQGLNKVYSSIANEYTRCETGRLISVYCRNPD